jgi:shikimate dehydrogenase
MKYFGVAGNPILHSKSPLLFEGFFKQASIKASYTRVAADSAGEVVFLFKSFGFQGMNVTTPFKNDIVSHLSCLDEVVSLTGSANTIVRDKNGLKGFNTDCLGVVGALEQRGLMLAGKRCVVLGAGGAGVAAAFGLIKRGAVVTVVNRTLDKAERIANGLGCRAADIKFLKDILKDADLLVSAISSGQKIVERDWLHRGLVVLDANYKDPVLSRMARSARCEIIEGEDWLYHQALGAFSVFTNQSAIEKKMSPALSAPDYWDMKKNNISLIGFMGCGKSSVAKILAASMNWRFIDSDEEIEKKEGMTIDRIFKEKGEFFFRAKEKMMVKKLRGLKGTVFSWGGGTVLDSENRNILREHSLGVFLFSTLESCLKRIGGERRPLLAGPDMEKKAERLYEERKKFYFSQADLMVNSEKNEKEVAGKIHDEIRQAFRN